jgi:hypothetical protein
MTGSGDFQIARAPDMAAATEIGGRKTAFPAYGTQTFQSVRPAELDSAAPQKKADRMSAWRTGHRPVFLIFAMPPGAADAADDADGSGQRDNPWSLYRGHGESGHVPDFLHFCRAGVPACQLN